MSRALQCPVCGHKHPVDELPDAPTFECEQCGRILKVPKTKRTTSSSVRSSGAAAAGAGATILPRRGVGSADQPHEPRGADATDSPDDPTVDDLVRLPVWLRILAWLIGLPLSAIVVFGVANATGLLTGSQLTDMFLDARLSAYGRLAALLPLWALLAAGVVQGIDVLWKAWVGRRLQAADSGAVDEHSRSDTVDA